MSKELTAFNILYDIGKSKLYTKEDIKKTGTSIFHLLAYIRSNPVLIPYASYLNQNHKMDVYNMYLFIFFTFRFYNIKYCKWIKTGKEAKNEEIEHIMDYYKVKRRIAEEYFQEMSKEELQEINSYYQE